MSTTGTLDQAKERLSELIAGLTLSNEVVITDKERPVAKLVNASDKQRMPRIPGSAEGILMIVHEDNERLREFEEYLQ